MAPDVVMQLIEEQLDEYDMYFLTTEDAAKLIKQITPRDINAQNYLFESLGWKKKKFSWDLGPQKSCWYREANPDYPASGSKGVWLPEGNRQAMEARNSKLQWHYAGYEPISLRLTRCTALWDEKEKEEYAAFLQ